MDTIKIFRPPRKPSGDDIILIREQMKNEFKRPISNEEALAFVRNIYQYRYDTWLQNSIISLAKYLGLMEDEVFMDIPYSL